MTTGAVELIFDNGYIAVLTSIVAVQLFTSGEAAECRLLYNSQMLEASSRTRAETTDARTRRRYLSS